MTDQIKKLFCRERCICGNRSAAVAQSGAQEMVRIVDGFLDDMREVRVRDQPTSQPPNAPANELEKIKRKIELIRDLSIEVTEAIYANAGEFEPDNQFTEYEPANGVRPCCGIDGVNGDEIVNVGRIVYGICENCAVYWVISDGRYSDHAHTYRDEVQSLDPDEARELWAEREARLKASYKPFVPAVVPSA